MITIALIRRISQLLNSWNTSEGHRRSDIPVPSQRRQGILRSLNSGAQTVALTLWEPPQ